MENQTDHQTETAAADDILTGIDHMWHGSTANVVVSHSVTD